uniref:Uncharacterized protein n=1 Tax=Kalanchoe fedtschenkoi TaxID=63787 RepID=A0A7N0VEB1_KALFE
MVVERTRLSLEQRQDDMNPHLRGTALQDNVADTESRLEQDPQESHPNLSTEREKIKQRAPPSLSHSRCKFYLLFFCLRVTFHAARNRMTCFHFTGHGKSRASIRKAASAT